MVVLFIIGRNYQSISFYFSLSTTIGKARDAKECQGQDFRPAQGWNGLKDHQEYAWWNCWWPYVTLSLELHARSAQNCMFVEGIRDHSHQEHHYAVMDWIVAKPTRFHCSISHIYRLDLCELIDIYMIWKWLGRKWCNQMKQKFSCLASTLTAAFLFIFYIRVHDNLTAGAGGQCHVP